MAAKAVSLVKEEADHELTCPVCLELFKTPKTLPCLHTFCEECLKGVEGRCFVNNKRGVECPTCRAKHVVPPKGVEGFTTNFTATNLVELLNLKNGTDSSALVLKCEDGIDDNPAATKCLDCNFYLCEECTADHKKRRVSRRHKIATLAELKEGGATQLQQKRYCNDHEGEELKLYCRTCQEVICRDCTIVTHKQHDYTFIKDVREELTKKIASLVASVDGKETEYQSLLASIHQASEKEEQELANGEVKVKAFFDKHIAELQLRIEGLQNHKSTVLSNLAAYSSVHTKQLLADEESLQFSQTRLTNARSFTQQQLSSASNTDLAMMSKQVIQQLRGIRKHKFKIVDAPLWEVSLSEDNPLNSKIEYLSADQIANCTNYHPPNPTLVGKNTFQISARVQQIFKLMKPEVTVTLSSGDSCPVNILSSGNNNTWSVTYYVTQYPQPGKIVEVSSDDDDDSDYVQPDRNYHRRLTATSAVPMYTVKISVEINGMQAINSPKTLQLENELAVGTMVENFNNRGTVVSYQQYQQYYNSTYPQHQGYGYQQRYGYSPAMEQPVEGRVFVQWNSGTGGTSGTQQMIANQLKVLTQ